MNKIIYNFLHFIMKYAGQLNCWAWKEHVKILKRKQMIEHRQIIKNRQNQEYLQMLVENHEKN